jgi:beta-phosphoglucomutase-like phosphatase (HAD superfamily)
MLSQGVYGLITEHTMHPLALLCRTRFKIAVVTSSQSCAALLKAAKLDKFFDVRVDGNVIHAQRLSGGARAAAETLADEIARFPQEAVRADPGLSWKPMVFRCEKP